VFLRPQGFPRPARRGGSTVVTQSSAQLNRSLNRRPSLAYRYQSWPEPSSRRRAPEAHGAVPVPRARLLVISSCTTRPDAYETIATSRSLRPNWLVRHAVLGAPVHRRPVAAGADSAAEAVHGHRPPRGTCFGCRRWTTVVPCWPFPYLASALERGVAVLMSRTFAPCCPSARLPVAPHNDAPAPPHRDGRGPVGHRRVQDLRLRDLDGRPG